MKTLSAIAILSLCITVNAFAGTLTPKQAVEQALQAYRNGLDTTDYNARIEHFRRAMRLFLYVVDDHHIENAELLVNLGNAAMQAGEPGYAIWAFRKACRINPGHRQAGQNLEFARQNLLPHWVPRPETGSLLDNFFYWYRIMPLAAKTMIITSCFILFAFATAVYIRWRLNAARNIAALLFIVWITLFTVNFMQKHRPADNTDAVVITGDLQACSADSTGALPRFSQPLPAGTELKISQIRGEWAHIALHDNRDAWVKSSALRNIN